MPVDEAMKDAESAKARQRIQALFSTRQHQCLVPAHQMTASDQ